MSGFQYQTSSPAFDITGAVYTPITSIIAANISVLLIIF